MTRLPKDYSFKETTQNNYFKIGEEKQAFRILTSPIIWYEYFREDKDWKAKPVRQRTPFNGTPADSLREQAPKEFWAFVVYNHNEEKIQIMELTQRTIMKAIIDFSNSEDWGDPKVYDLEISKSGKGTDTKYAITPLPKSRFASDDKRNEALEEAEKVNLEALFEGGNPFDENPF